jgi:putative tryptophan/tyrosine transport system substrate-binding protein
MRRREFITLLGGGAAVAWPLAVRAQQAAERTRRIGLMLSGTESDPETQARLAALRQGLGQLGWREGSNLRFDYRWPAGDPELVKRHAAELVASAPDLILTGLTPAVQALRRETRSIPIVFANIADPVGSGIVPSLAKPGGNVTGFTALEYAIVGKWLELLKEIAPGIERVTLIGGVDDGFAKSFQHTLEAIAPTLAVKPVAAEVRSAADIERTIDAFAREPNGGLLVVPALTASLHRAVIFRMADRHRMPAVYPFRFYAVDGGLASYGPDIIDQYRRVAGYVDRILRGAKPADLPVQAPTKFDLVVNLRTAKALGIEIPPIMLGRADELIE